MYALKVLGLFATSESKYRTWAELVNSSLNGEGEEALRKMLANRGVDNVDAAVDAIHWLGLMGDIPLCE